MQLTVLTDDEVNSIHQASLDILNGIGVILTHPVGRELLTGVGAVVQGDRVRLPPDLVESQIRRCPQQVTLRDREGKPVTLGAERMHWHNLGGAREVYDPIKGGRRLATVQDVRDSTRLLDALEQVTTITPFFTPTDVQDSQMSLAMYRYTLPSTTKPVHGPGVHSAAEVKLIAEMASVIGQPEELLSLGVSPISPLYFPDNIFAAIIETARLGVTLTPLPCPTAGATAPLSLAGALAQQNAEVLASIVLAQLVRPGMQIVYCGRLSVMEPRTGTSVWGGVELGLISAATVQIAHRYGLPVNVYGLSTNALVPDLQNGYERALNACLPALAGADELSGIGEMEAGVMGSYVQMVLDNEIAASVQRMKRGFSVNAHSLALEVITEVMGGARNYLSEAHTVQYLRSGEVLFSRLAERRSWSDWERAGRVGMEGRAQAEAARLLKEHHVIPLNQDQERELDRILSTQES